MSYHKGLTVLPHHLPWLVAKDISIWKDEEGVALHHYIDDSMLTGDDLAILHKALKSLQQHLERW